MSQSYHLNECFYLFKLTFIYFLKSIHFDLFQILPLEKLKLTRAQLLVQPIVESADDL